MTRVWSAADSTAESQSQAHMETPGSAWSAGCESDVHVGGDHGANSTSTSSTSAETAATEARQRKRRQLAYALHALKLYNPDFALTPEVLDIMRAFFEDLRPDAQGYISLGALFDEIERLDPEQRLVAADTRRRMRRDMARRTRDRLDFEAFCAWVMRWKEINPRSVQNVYTSWAKQIAALDFGMSEGESMFVVLRPEDQPPNDELTMEILELLQARQKLREERQQQQKQRVRPVRDAATPSDMTTASQSLEEYEQCIDGYGEQGKESESQALAEENDAPDAEQSSGKASFLVASKSFIAGGTAGMVAKSVLAPLDRVKILFQVNDQRQFSFRNAARMARNIYVHDGFLALFRGNMLNIVRVIPYAGLQHSGFDFFRRQFHAYNFRQAEREGSQELRKLSNLQLVTAGSLAGGLSLVVAYPLDIVRARYMVQQGKHRYNSIYEAVSAMYKEGGARSFSRGLLPSLLGTLPYTGIGFSLNERFKIWMLEFQRRRLDDKFGAEAPEPRLNPLSKFVCSYFAACIAQTTTYPMDTIRRRIQTDGYVTEFRGRPSELKYTGVVTTARIIMAREGWRGLFKGVSVNWMRSPVSTGISLTTYDLLKEVMGIEKIE